MDFFFKNRKKTFPVTHTLCPASMRGTKFTNL